MIKESKTPLFDLVPVALRPALKKEIEAILEEEKRALKATKKITVINGEADTNKGNSRI